MKQRLELARETASTLDEQRRAALAEMRQSLAAIRQLSDTLAQLRQQCHPIRGRSVTGARSQVFGGRSLGDRKV